MVSTAGVFVYLISRNFKGQKIYDHQFKINIMKE